MTPQTFNLLPAVTRIGDYEACWVWPGRSGNIVGFRTKCGPVHRIYTSAELCLRILCTNHVQKYTVDYIATRDATFFSCRYALQPVSFIHQLYLTYNVSNKSAEHLARDHPYKITSGHTAQLLQRLHIFYHIQMRLFHFKPLRCEH